MNLLRTALEEITLRIGAPMTIALNPHLAHPDVAIVCIGLFVIGFVFGVLWRHGWKA